MKTLIVGGGLAGLSLAYHLSEAGRDFCLVEARDRFGGRILTEHVGDSAFDLGPAWFWPGQPRIAKLIGKLRLEYFEQFSQGSFCYEDTNGQVHTAGEFASMQGSLRVAGGIAAFTDALVQTLPAAKLRTQAQVVSLTKTQDGIVAGLADGATLTADHVVLAIPPRVAGTLDFTPLLPQAAMTSLATVPTWMAGHAKAIAVYDQAFWRDAGLSGDASSRIGPMVEIHDASPASGGPYGLFGFLGVPAMQRTDEVGLRDQILEQFVRIFGPQAASPRALLLKDWAMDPMTSVPADAAPLHAHPRYGLPMGCEGLWANRLHFGSTEMAPQFGGFLEGALEAAEIVFHALVPDTQEVADGVRY
ncbi:flavin monoamine oxidase family protein [Algirhabdus cladophorae]|uniref:flavin monoamine oxidase family protein n=1 Tax=Algirhabdus cladophorae TaxID=3377108 RepID=UPI003B84B4E4